MRYFSIRVIMIREGIYCCAERINTSLLSLFCYISYMQNVSILCLIPRTTVTSLSAPKDTRCCKTHPLCVNPGVPFWTCEKTHKLRVRWQASSSGIRADVTVVLEVRQSLTTISIHPLLRFASKIMSIFLMKSQHSYVLVMVLVKHIFQFVLGHKHECFSHP